MNCANIQVAETILDADHPELFWWTMEIYMSTSKCLTLHKYHELWTIAMLTGGSSVCSSLPAIDQRMTGDGLEPSTLHFISTCWPAGTPWPVRPVIFTERGFTVRWKGYILSFTWNKLQKYYFLNFVIKIMNEIDYTIEK